MNGEAHPAMRRVLVAGIGGSGKSTLSRSLAPRLGVPGYCMDELYFGGPDLGMSPLFPDTIDRISSRDWWLFDSQGTPPTSQAPLSVREMLWTRADTLVWLDYPKPVVLARVARRHLMRVVTRERLWHGYREPPWAVITDRTHPIRRAWALHAERRAELAERIADPAWEHLAVVRLTGPDHAQRWLDGLPGRGDGNGHRRSP